MSSDKHSFKVNTSYIGVQNRLHQEKRRISIPPPTSLGVVWNIHYYDIYWCDSARMQNTINRAWNKINTFRRRREQIYCHRTRTIKLTVPYVTSNWVIAQCFLLCSPFSMYLNFTIRIKVWYYLIIAFNFTYFPHFWCARLVMVQRQSAWVFRAYTLSLLENSMFVPVRNLTVSQ